jgi:hypothetical protein
MGVNLILMAMSSLFSREAVTEMKRRRFSGNLLVKWEDGIINDIEFDRDLNEM